MSKKGFGYNSRTSTKFHFPPTAFFFRLVGDVFQLITPIHYFPLVSFIFIFIKGTNSIQYLSPRRSENSRIFPGEYIYIYILQNIKRAHNRKLITNNRGKFRKIQSLKRNFILTQPKSSKLALFHLPPPP